MTHLQKLCRLGHVRLHFPGDRIAALDWRSFFEFWPDDTVFDFYVVSVPLESQFRLTAFPKLQHHSRPDDGENGHGYCSFIIQAVVPRSVTTSLVQFSKAAVRRLTQRAHGKRAGGPVLVADVRQYHVVARVEHAVEERDHADDRWENEHFDIESQKGEVEADFLAIVSER